MSGKRTNYLSWENYFMATAILAAQRSKDPKTQVGACLVNDDNVIVGIGYNGFPKNCSDDKFSWATRKQSYLDNKHLYVSHAEVNAILNKNSRDTKGCRLYVTLFPCNECVKIIIQSDIKQIFYLRKKNEVKPETIAADKMLKAAGIICSEFKTKLDVKVFIPESKDESESQSASPPKKPCKEEINNSH